MLTFRQFICENYDNIKQDAKKMKLDSFLNKYSVEGKHIENQKTIPAHHVFNIDDIDPSEHDSWSHPDLSPYMEKKVKENVQMIKLNSTPPPILVKGSPEDKKYRPMVLDGHHRVIAAYRAGVKTIHGWLDDETLKEIHKNAN